MKFAIGKFARNSSAICVLCFLPILSQAQAFLVSGFGSDKVFTFDAAGNPMGSLTGHQFRGPQAILRGPDNRIYIADESNNAVVRYNANLTFDQIFVTSGSGGLSGPTGLTFDGAGSLLVSAFNTNRVQKHNGINGSFISNLIPSNLAGPDVGFTRGPDGLLYIPSFWGNSIKRYNAATGAFVDDFVTGISTPRTILWRGGLMYVSSDSGATVKRYNALTGALVDTFVQAGSGGISSASGMLFDKDGNLLVTCWRNDMVAKYNGTTGAFMSTFISPGAGGLDGPTVIFAVPEPISIFGMLAGGAFLFKKAKDARSN